MRTPTMMRSFLPQPTYYLVRLKSAAEGQLGISRSRRSMDIVSSEYSQQQLACDQETDHT